MIGDINIILRFDFSSIEIFRDFFGGIGGDMRDYLNSFDEFISFKIDFFNIDLLIPDLIDFFIGFEGEISSYSMRRNSIISL